MYIMFVNMEGCKLILDGFIFDKVLFFFEQDLKLGDEMVLFGVGVLGCWIVDLDKGLVILEWFDDWLVEFFKVDEWYFGKGYENGFMISGDDLWFINIVIKWNVKIGKE